MPAHGGTLGTAQRCSSTRATGRGRCPWAEQCTHSTATQTQHLFRKAAHKQEGSRGPHAEGRGGGVGLGEGPAHPAHVANVTQQSQHTLAAGGGQRAPHSTRPPTQQRLRARIHGHV